MHSFKDITISRLSLAIQAASDEVCQGILGSAVQPTKMLPKKSRDGIASLHRDIGEAQKLDENDH